MLRHAIQRLAMAVPVMFGVLLVGFLLMQVVPTDPAVVRAGPTASAEVVDAIRRDLGLDKPLWVQFGLYLWRLAQGDLGVSIINNVPVSQELAATVGPTLELMAASLVWSIPLGIAMGTIGAYWRGSLLDRMVMAISVVGVSVPVFFVGLLLIWLVGFHWQLLPFTGRTGPLWTLEGLRGVALPAITLGGVFVGPIARMTRTAVRMLEEAGWRVGADGIRVKEGIRASFLNTGTNALENQRQSEIIQQALRRVGIEMRIQLFDATVAWGRLATQEFDAFFLSYPYFSAGDALNLYWNSFNRPTPNRMNWNNPQTDAWLLEARTALDPQVRARALANVQRQLAEDAPWLTIAREQLFVASSNRVQGVRAHGLYGIGVYKGLDMRIVR